MTGRSHSSTSPHARACAGQAPKEIGDALHNYTLWLFAKANQHIDAL